MNELDKVEKEYLLFEIRRETELRINDCFISKYYLSDLEDFIENKYDIDLDKVCDIFDSCKSIDKIKMSNEELREILNEVKRTDIIEVDEYD